MTYHLPMECHRLVEPADQSSHHVTVVTSVLANDQNKLEILNKYLLAAHAYHTKHITNFDGTKALASCYPEPSEM